MQIPICATMMVSSMIMFVLSSCAGPVESLFPAKSHAESRKIYIVNNGWHAGIVVDRKDFNPGMWEEHTLFPDARFIEVGWGDEGFYQAREISSGLAVKALFWPTPTVLHLVGISVPVRRFFYHLEVEELTISRKGLDRLLRFIRNTFERDQQNQTTYLGKGLYGDSRFYRAKGTYSIFRTCNAWTAEALREAGVPITPFYAFTSANVMDQVRDAQQYTLIHNFYIRAYNEVLD